MTTCDHSIDGTTRVAITENTVVRECLNGHRLEFPRCPGTTFEGKRCKNVYDPKKYAGCRYHA